MKKKTNHFTCLGVSMMLILSALTGCGSAGQSRNLMDDMRKEQVNAAGNDSGKDREPADGAAQDSGAPIAAAADLPGADAVTYTDFAIHLFQECAALTEDNLLISPLSILNALAMTAGGAGGETLSQMEKLFGADPDSLGSYLHAFNESLPAGEKYRLHTANSIWVKDTDSFTVSPEFLQTNADRFNSDVYAAPFDESTLRDINGWVSEHTDQMIPEILDEIPADAVMYLINALAFDAEWQTVYKDYRVQEGTFTCEDGSVQEAEMMYSKEHAYLQDSRAQGFIKYYSDGKYGFAALLPQEGISLEEYAASLTGRGLHELLSNPEKVTVNAAIPKFESEYGVCLNDILMNLGMTAAFDSHTADFSGLGSSLGGNLYISSVLHKTYIAVDEIGTKAGAATAVEIEQESAMLVSEEPKTVYLDRPFLYMIIDCEERLPLFMGMVTELNRQ